MWWSVSAIRKSRRKVIAFSSPLIAEATLKPAPRGPAPGRSRTLKAAKPESTARHDSPLADHGGPRQVQPGPSAADDLDGLGRFHRDHSQGTQLLVSSIFTFYTGYFHAG